MYLLFLKTVTRVMIINKMRHTSPKWQKSRFDRFRRCTVGWLQPYSVTTRKHTNDSVRLRATSARGLARRFSFLFFSFLLSCFHHFWEGVDFFSRTCIKWGRDAQTNTVSSDCEGGYHARYSMLLPLVCYSNKRALASCRASSLSGAFRAAGSVV